MQLKTILNRVERCKSFVYGKITLEEGEGEEGPYLEVSIEPRANGRPICSGCGCVRPGYDRLPPRRFEFVPLWQIPVFFLYAMRRVNCPECGVTVERVPWSDGKSRHTKSYQWFLARWAQRMSWKEVAESFHTTWERVREAVKHAVFWGIAHRSEDGIESIGVDEIQWQRGHKYLTLIYQLDDGKKRLLWIAKERTEESLRGFFRFLGAERILKLRFVCSDMWRAYLKVIREEAPGAVHILDRFHVMSAMNKAIDKIRAEEARSARNKGFKQVLKHSRWCLLKRPENLTEKQTVKLSELMKYNLKSLRGRLQREDFQRFWQYHSPGWAGRFLDEWCKRVMSSKLEPMKKVARSLQRHRELILNWFRAGGEISAGTVEGFNNKAKLIIRRSYGFREYETIELALFHQLGALPQPKFTHEFC
jgi:transposase